MKPGPVPGLDGRAQAPHLIVGILMRGLLHGLFTRAYFPLEDGQEPDPILSFVPEDRRHTLLLRRSDEDSTLLLWTIRMQGEDETVFFDY